MESITLKEKECQFLPRKQIHPSQMRVILNDSSERMIVLGKNHHLVVMNYGSMMFLRLIMYDFENPVIVALHSCAELDS